MDLLLTGHVERGDNYVPVGMKVDEIVMIKTVIGISTICLLIAYEESRFGLANQCNCPNIKVPCRTSSTNEAVL